MICCLERRHVEVIKVELPAWPAEKFRRYVGEKYGFHRGALSKAMIDLIEKELGLKEPSESETIDSIVGLGLETDYEWRGSSGGYEEESKGRSLPIIVEENIDITFPKLQKQPKHLNKQIICYTTYMRNIWFLKITVKFLFGRGSSLLIWGIVLDKLSNVLTILILLTILFSHIPIIEASWIEGDVLRINMDKKANVLKIVDALGRVVYLNKTPTRIVSLAPSITETIFYLGLENYLVGVDSISYNDPYYGIHDYVVEHDVKDVGGYWWSAVKVEDILSLSPDLVLADKGAHQPLLDTFESYNLTVIYLNGGASKTLNDIYSDMLLLSNIYDCKDKAVKFMEDVENVFNEYKNAFSKYSGLKTLVIVGIYNGIWVAGKDTYIDNILEKLGLGNVADVEGWKAVSIEKIYQWDPDLIIIDSEYIDEKTLHDIGLYNLGAHIVFLDKEGIDALSRPGPLILKVPMKLYYAIGTNIPPPLPEPRYIEYILLFTIVFIMVYRKKYSIHYESR